MKPPRPQVIVGFEPFPQQTKAPVRETLPGLSACTACSARQEALQVVPGKGPLDSRVMFLGQNPGEEEDTAGEPFVGLSGTELDVWLKILGFERSHVFITNVVKCHTYNNRAPRTIEVQTCSFTWLPKELALLTQLLVIFPLGKPAVERILGKSAPPMMPLSIYHFRIKLLGRELSVFPLPHPAFLLRAQHMAPTFRDVLLPQVRETLQHALPACYDASRRAQS